MADYFTSDHFKLLNKWKGQKKDSSNPEQQRAYDDLKKAYEVTEAWAHEVKAKMFPQGRVEVLKKPTNQANNFAAYNWARIYPSPEAPKELAFTVGIGADDGFVVKIDTVGLDDSNPVRKTYMELRGPYDNTSSIVAKLPAVEGLNKSLPELIDWSIGAIRAFRLRYSDIVSKLNIGQNLSDEELLKHFDGKVAFATFRASWTPPEKTLFCRLARAVHSAGLDWWHATKAVQIRFGRKNPGSERAAGVMAIVRGTRLRTIAWHHDIGAMMANKARVPLTDALVSKIEAALDSNRDSLQEWLPLNIERPGLWPDQLREEHVESEEDMDDETTETGIKSDGPVNRIYYGPPGTGKTYQLGVVLKRDYEQPLNAVSDTDWRNQVISEKIAVLKWWEGAAIALYDLGGKAKVSQLLDHEFVRAIMAANPGNKSPTQTLWGALQFHTVVESETVKTKKGVSPAIFDKDADSTWKFAGSWEEECADLIKLVDSLKNGPRSLSPLQRYSFVTFHQSYGYEEFVEGLRPVLATEAEPGDIQYEIRPGVFKDLCRRARLAPDQRFAMVIDEINRGNISKIFGELITLIERDKRDGAENAVSLTLPYSGEFFSVPANVDIIGTMNTADRSLALLDTALRRRFEFVPVMPNASDESGAPLSGLRVTMGGQEIDIPRMLAAINQRVEALYDRDHCIGHSYFVPLKKVLDVDEQLVELQQIFSSRILPLLEEYFFEDWQKIRLVLADNQKAEAAQFIVECADHEDDLARLFGSDHDLNSYATKHRYAVQVSAFSNPDAYIGIYKTLSA